LKAFTDYLVKNAFFTFPWPAYLDALKPDYFSGVVDQNLKEFDKIMKSVDLKTHQKPYFEMDELNERFVSNKAFKQSVHIGFRNNVAEKFAKCQTAKGNFFLSENSSNMIVIANLNWLSDVINLISTGNLLSNDVQFVKKLIGKQIRLWTQEQFIKELEKLISKEKVTFSIRTILSILYGFLSLTFLFQD
jgi:hypothetical protein